MSCCIATLQQNKHYKKLALLFNVRLHLFLHLVSSDRPRLSHFQKQKKADEEDNNLTLLLIWYIDILFCPYGLTDFQSFPFNYKENVSLSHRRSWSPGISSAPQLLHRKVSVISLCCCICSSEGLAATNVHLHFLSRCFHDPRMLCWGTEPPSSTLLLLFLPFPFLFWPTNQPKIWKRIRR